MPGVVMMDGGASHFQSTNHDRSNGPRTNGAQGSPNGLVNHVGNQSALGTNTMPNGNTDGSADAGSSRSPAPVTSRMNDLPDEIQHITQGFIPLRLLLCRLAQQTQNELGDEIMALAKMPLPSSVMNGNGVGADASVDDNSPENLNKKVRLLNFVQEKHGEWVKALIIVNWSRKAEPVSKLIDLMHHINKTRAVYQASLDYMINIRRDLTYARIPNPDLRTALQVLSTGQAPWMPELNYIQPPQITPEEQLRWIENLNTLLSIRLNLDEHENIPEQFQNFEIQSGRITFKVPREFEVDLTIADEDPEKQFWFIDFRFAFQPAPSELTDRLREVLELKVNEALQKDGLPGCYKFLHEFVLTHKITEYYRQAMDLSRGRWVDMLAVERLRRAMAIHYWSGRRSDGPQSYLIMGVSSGKDSSSIAGQRNSSRLTLRWFRDGTEVKDVQFPLDEESISTEALLNRVIGKHTEHILRGFHNVMKSQGRYVEHEASLGLNIVDGRPEESALTMQLSHEQCLTIKVAPITGMLLAMPPSKGNFDLQSQLNKEVRRPVTDQVALLERFRCSFVEDELNRRGKSRGWSVCNRPPVKPEEARQFLGIRGTYQLIWLKRRGLPDGWYIMVGQSLNGDQWWLTEIIERSDSNKIMAHARLPLSPSIPRYSDKFFAELTFFSSAMMSQIGILGAMHKERMKYAVQDRINPLLPPNMKVPSIHVRLSEILGRHHPHVSKNISSWAFDTVEINLKTIENRLPQSMDPAAGPGSRGSNEGIAPLASEQHRYNIVVDARVKVADPSRFGPLRGNVERDVAFNERLGVFAFSIEAAVGSSILDTLAHRLQALSRLAGSIDAIRQSPQDVQCEEITLNNVKFSYTDRARSTNAEAQQNSHRWTASLDLQTENIKLILDPGNPQLRAAEQFDKLINSAEGFKGVPWFLSTTLPIHRALSSVEHAWEALAMTNQCRVNISVISLDCYTIQYTLNLAKDVSRCLTLFVKLQSYNAVPQWHVYREETGPQRQPDDEFQKILQKVWLSGERPWRRLGPSVAADATDGIEALVKATDEAIRPLAVKSPSISKQPQPKMAAQKNVGQTKSVAASKPRPPQQTGLAGKVVISLDD
ncbi:putative mediator of RNA polymerase II transcription subunit 14 [Rosellinia necatrix]|uniref:Mediator of RNA polymerase II transcription subunit 14 n=1 Tax=Rosellinia necatrix TaxID=77044 RepID=A0A1S7UJJ0_ROSNE|nr:putative mediator of RNA polymerase II transcription subunit 14 [Rosellinia necatrix]